MITLRNLSDQLTTVFGVAVMSGGPVIGIVSCYCGDLNQGEKALGVLTSFGPTLMNSLGTWPYLDFQHSFEEFNPVNVSAYRKSNFIREITDETIDVIAEYISRVIGPFFIGLFPYSGAICRVGPSDTAFPIRGKGYELWFDAYWRQSSEAEPSRAWTNRFWNAVRSFTTGAV